MRYLTVGSGRTRLAGLPKPGSDLISQANSQAFRAAGVSELTSIRRRRRDFREGVGRASRTNRLCNSMT